MTSAPLWDIFCRVIDNYGDIGVTWRLARQLCNEHRIAVRLWVDDLGSFRRLCSEVDPDKTLQTIGGVEIRLWPDPWPEDQDIHPGSVVIEAFACQLPVAFITRMRQRKPHWINLEYLSVEPWAADWHALPSPDPASGLIKRFFFPGIHRHSGGLIKEAALDQERDQEQARAKTEQEPLQGEKATGRLAISMFAYDNPGIRGLLTAWSKHPSPIDLYVPESRITPLIGEWIEEQKRSSNACEILIDGHTATLGSLTLHRLPFLSHSEYDRLLWRCQLNFVRGEDSLVRGLWAEQALVWQAYPQEDSVHLDKLEAWLQAFAHPEQNALWRAWNLEDAQQLEVLWPDYARQLDHHRQACRHLAEWASRHGDLARRLTALCPVFPPD